MAGLHGRSIAAAEVGSRSFHCRGSNAVVLVLQKSRMRSAFRAHPDKTSIFADLLYIDTIFWLTLPMFTPANKWRHNGGDR